MDGQDIRTLQGCGDARLRKVTDKEGLIFQSVGNKYDIVNTIARKRMVETMIANIAHQSLSSDLQDLAQMVYVILLEYDDEKVIDLWENKQMKFFIARIIINQFRSSNSPFHKIYRKYQDKSVDITGMDFIDEDGE